MTTFPKRLALVGATGGLLVLAALLTSCAPDTTAPELQSRVAQAESAETQTLDADNAALDQTASTVRVAFTDQACLDCHTDRARLQELAVEPEETESLSSGPG